MYLVRVDVDSSGVRGERVLADRAHLEPEARPGQQKREHRYECEGQVKERSLVEHRVSEDRDATQAAGSPDRGVSTLSEGFCPPKISR